MPHLKTSHKEDATITLSLDPSFTGVIRGIAHDESEGCTVKGNCIVQVNKPIKIRRFVVWLEGRCKVTLKAGSYGYTVANTETNESRTIYSKDHHFIGDDGLTHLLTPGHYLYPFSFELPPSLPASFRGKRGYVRYRLQAAIYRPMFAHDIHVSRDIPIKRCLLNDETPMAELRETYEGRQHTNKIHYEATAPSITYREGGLIRLNINMRLLKPEHQSVRTVTCALRERVQYRTTDGQANTICSKTDNLFPLGYSTFYPSQSPDYDPKEQADYNALFRLCPRVNADLNSRLMKVTHALVVNIMMEDRSDEKEEDESAFETDATDTEWASEDDHQNTVHSFQSISSDTKQTHESPNTTPPASAPSSPILSRSSSASSLVSIFSLARSHPSSPNPSHGDDYLAAGMTSIPAVKSARRKHRHKDTHEPRLILCTLEVPLVVTSREHTWNDKPSHHLSDTTPPSYDTVEKPPTYHMAIENLPRAPIYDRDDPSPCPSEPSTPPNEEIHRPSLTQHHRHSFTDLAARVFSKAGMTHS
ncbi:Arrestin domain-containing protein C31A2.12 [Choanephora cucurbitarum]|uniref:Arrestin domain-containing protein C31A2.12 n=1 Tax=Choanephora cucurbitarum TaxID=101091 RepID=A0A1C7NF49_9FUNG|nr:Arrestin domain-containing protein C31A2.12 [Choanephora cucurbitarum]